jgi:hypothetical protein
MRGRRFRMRCVLTAPLFATIFFGAALKLSPLGLGVKLALILAGSLGVAAVIRRIAGVAAIRRHKTRSTASIS